MKRTRTKSAAYYADPHGDQQLPWQTAARPAQQAETSTAVPCEAEELSDGGIASAIASMTTQMPTMRAIVPPLTPGMQTSATPMRAPRTVFFAHRNHRHTVEQASRFFTSNARPTHAQPVIGVH